MAHPNVALVQKMYQCFQNGDVDTLHREILAPDLVWRVPGRHPLSGTVRGIDEVLAFFGEMAKTGLIVETVRIDVWGEDIVIETHNGHGEVAGVKLHAFSSFHGLGGGLFAFQIKNGRIVDVQEYQGDQYGVDDFFCAACQLGPIPDRLAKK